jgi:hypothetical protein
MTEIGLLIKKVGTIRHTRTQTSNTLRKRCGERVGWFRFSTEFTRLIRLESLQHWEVYLLRCFFCLLP